MSVDMFLMINGIEGESLDDSHSGEIDLLSWSWGMSQSGTTHSGSGGGSGKASFQDISCTHYVDNASGNLMLYCANGQHIDEAVLTVRKAGANPLEYIIVTLNNAIVTSVNVGGAQGEDRLVESFTLNFGEVKVEYQKQAPDGSGSPGPEFGWNIPGNVPA